MTKIGNKNLQKTCTTYLCALCDYITDRKSSYDVHLTTLKHEKSINGNKNLQKTCNNLICQKCNKIYKDYSGLWRHKKKCNNISNNNEENNEKIDTNQELVKYLMKENAEFKQIILDVIKNGTYNSTTNNTNSHNKAFNLNFFLNETCKDAMNIMEFVDSIKLQLSDLERVGENGFVEGISNIIIQNLKDLDVTKRPVHCTDKKREVLYVKDENKWEKEDNTNKKVRKAIKHIASKNTKMLNVFREKYPDCTKSTSQYSDKYNKLVLESFGGSNNEDFDNENKIIKKISQEVTIEKE